MSRLEKSQPAQPLTEEQKRGLAEVDSEITARIAEKRIFIEGEIATSSGDEAAVEALRRQLASEVATLEEKRELKKEKVRSAKKSA